MGEIVCTVVTLTDLFETWQLSATATGKQVHLEHLHEHDLISGIIKSDNDLDRNSTAATPGASCA